MEEKLVFFKTNDIKPYENNAKIHDDAQIEMIIKSIKEFGFTNPLLIDENNNLIAGHGRLLAAERMGMSEVPCRVIKGLTYEQRRALILADNKIAEMAGWDYDKLEMELNSIADIDMADFGFDLEIDEHIEVQEDNYEIDEHIPTEPKAKYGQIYQLDGKDLSKADVSVNIYAHLKAQALNQPVEISCAIGDEYIDGHPYAEVVEIARSYIKKVGGFAKFAEWGLLNGEN